MVLKVGLDAREGFRPNPRGIGLYCRHLMREFGAMPDLQILAYHERPIPEDLPALAANIVPRRTEMKGSRFHLWEKVRMPVQMRVDRLDVYHGTYNTIPPRWFPWRRPGLLVTLHDVVVTWWEGDVLGSYGEHVRKVTSRVVREADKILTVSEFSKRDICERYDTPEDKVEIFYNGIPPTFLEDPPDGAGEDARKRFAQGRPYLFCIGSPLKRKNTRGFLHAIKQLKDSGRLQHRAVVTGLVGSDFDALRGFSLSLGIADDIDFHGYLPVADIAAIYAGADLMVYPSFAEGWGIPILESFAMGTPVAASRATSMPEAGADFARYFDPNDTEEMVEVIAQALEHRGEFEAAKAKKRARTFTWRAAAEKTLAVYREIA